MKSMNNDVNNTNWLAFSLSPHMKMEVPNQNHQTPQQSVSTASAVAVPTAIPTGFFHTPPLNLSYGSIFFGTEGDQNSGGLYSHLPVMPLKSDGSLCIMEALTRSNPQQVTTMVTTTTSTPPKLEDFFGGATMGTHHYQNNDRDTMALSLDSMYYHQDPNHQHQQYPYYSNFRTAHEMLLGEEAKVTHQVSDCNLQLPNNWVSRNYAMEQKSSTVGCMGDNGGESGSAGAMAFGDWQSLSLSMSPGSQSSCVTGSQQISPAVTDCAAMETRKRGLDKVDPKQIVHRKSIDTFGQRTSQYRGVTRHRWTGRYEAHLWDNSCKKEGQSRKGRQVYLGGYDMEEKAARAYDLAALKYWGPSTHINFPLENYQKEVEEMKNMTRQEYVAHLRRKSSGFSRGASMYRGVTRHHQHGRWQARIGRVAGNKDLYLGTFSTQEEAAEAYDIAAIKFRGVNAVTNFDITRYDVERIMASNTLLAGDLARRKKENIGSSNEAINQNPSTLNVNGETIPAQKNNVNEADWKMVLYQSTQQLNHKAPNAGDNYKNQAFSLPVDNEIGIDAISSVHQQQEVEESGKMGIHHVSNASSLVTSLSSSREGTPDRTGLPMLFAMTPSATSKLFATSPTRNVNSWIPTAASQLRPAVALPHMPVFATWTDG